jgi:hypothetical protein
MLRSRGEDCVAWLDEGPRQLLFELRTNTSRSRSRQLLICTKERYASRRETAIVSRTHENDQSGPRI